MLLGPGAAVPTAASTPSPEPALPTRGPIADAPLPAPAGKTALVSQRAGGGFPNGASAEPAISADGRYVAFASGATNLAPGAATSSPAVYVRDRTRNRNQRLPLPPGFSGGGSREPSISADGNVVAWTYQPPSGFTALGSIVVAWDRRTGKTEVVSRNTKGTAADRSREPTVSGDGRYVSYSSDNPAISLQDDVPNTDVFRYDRRTKKTVFVSIGAGGHSTGATSSAPSISANGNLVAFQSDAGDVLVPENTGAGTQVYVRDLAAKETERISVPRTGGAANGPAAAPSISADGRYVAFESSASNLVQGDNPQTADVFRRDRQADATVRVSTTPDGGSGNGPSGQAAISADGRMVAFASAATDLVGATASTADARLAAVAPGPSEVFERDVQVGETVLVSVGLTGGPGGSRSLTPVVAGLGRYVAFASLSTVLVRADRNKQADVFIRDFPPVPRLSPALVSFGTRAVGSAPVPGAAILANAGWGPLAVKKASTAGPNDFAVAADACNGRTLYRTEACTLTVTFAARQAGARAGTLRVPTALPGAPPSTRLRGIGSRAPSKARLTIDPDIGPPGTVVVATGIGFPPNTEVHLAWSKGLTPTMPKVVTDASGRFTAQVLVFHNDLVGPRDLTATAGGGAPPTASMLVTRPSVGPPGFSIIRRLVDLPVVLLLRG